MAASARATSVASASLLMLGLALQISPAQAQNFVPAPIGHGDKQWVAVDDQIVPFASVVGHKSHHELDKLSLFPNARKWPEGLVPYTYDPNMLPAKRALFESACREWEIHANLKFVPRTSETNYIVVTSTADASNSYVGMIGGGQVLNLADWANKLTAVHELAHALGIIHEQSRPDRDTYVTIQTENIVDGMGRNFDKINGALNQSPYDFDSMMHYPGTAFSKNGKQTITAKPGFTEFQNRMGQRSRVSDNDKTGMAMVYGLAGANAQGVLAPDPPKTNDVLTATVPDRNLKPNETAIYVWDRNGVRIQDETSNKLDLSKPNNGDKGDEIRVIFGRRVANDNGTVSLENDGDATVTIINSAPSVKAAPTFKTFNTKTLTGQLTGSDVDEDGLTFIIVTPPENGTLVLNADGTFTYTANAGFVGTDGFKAASNDGSVSSLPETFSIEVTPENKPPVFADMQLRVTPNIPFSTSLGATDPNGDELFYQLVSGTLPNGLSLGFDGIISGTPTTLQTTTANISVEDGQGGKTSANITITVKADDRAPIVTATIAPTAPKTGDTLTVTANVNNQAQGAVTTNYDFKVNGKSVQSGSSNTLDLAVAGQGDKGDVISCDVTATNEGGGKGSASVSAAVINSAPVSVSNTGFTNADELTAFDLSGFDADGDPLTLTIVGPPTKGTATTSEGTDGKVKLFYRSQPGFSGTDVVRFTVSDEEATSANVSTFAIGVKNVAPPVNRAPVAGDTTINTTVGTPVTKGLLGRDPDGDAITFRIVNNARYGKSEIKRDKDGLWKLFYTSLNRLYGPDRVTYIAVDSRGKNSNVATIAINFINRSPLAKGNAITVASGVPTSQYLFANDPDNDAVSFRLVNNARYGKGEIKRDAQGAWRVYYQSLGGYVGPDRINFIAIDAAGKQSDAATVTINVIRPATQPSAKGALQNGGEAPSAGKS